LPHLVEPAPEPSQEHLTEAPVIPGSPVNEAADAARTEVDQVVEEAEAYAQAAPKSAVTGYHEGLAGLMAPSPDYVRPTEPNRDRFDTFKTNPLKITAEEPVSTFSVDVDTASYAFVRTMLNRGIMPHPDQVRVEEMINYFDYDYAMPEGASEPFSVSTAVYETPWNAGTQILHVGLRGFDVAPETKPQANLVFLIDVSGSMQNTNKLPLLKSAFKMMVNRLSPEDTVSIVTYAGTAGTALEPTKVSDKRTILRALDRLTAGGSTAGAAGIEGAYALAEDNFVEGGVNRVLLATDGDFNVGMTDHSALTRLIEDKRESGIFLSVLGFGMGNYNDALMQRLAQNGNGSAAYIDTLQEAQKVLVEEASGTLFPIAKDVKVQVEFNPARVAEYRLIGYETRALNREDFNNDAVDAGEIGSGHRVTALYEITPVGSDARLTDPLRYGETTADAPDGSSADGSSELAFVKLRYKQPDGETSKLITRPINERDVVSAEELPQEMRFAAAVAAFGQKLRGSDYLGDYGYDEMLTLAQGARGEDAFGHRQGFLQLVRLARSLDGKGTVN
ncbi:MAG: VWA domain-containing protein, partial [Pseudomonadota bacterium]